LIDFATGYHAVGVRVTIVAIEPSPNNGVTVHNLVSANLSSRRERIKHASRMIKLCGILPVLERNIGERKDADMITIYRSVICFHGEIDFNCVLSENGNTVEIIGSKVRKTYQLQGDDAQ
jgi:hypothetical protein